MARRANVSADFAARLRSSVLASLSSDDRQGRASLSSDDSEPSRVRYTTKHGKVAEMATGCAQAPAPSAPAATAPAKPFPRPVAGTWPACLFPPESDAAKIDDATVGLRAVVSADGIAETVAVLDDPGHGFGRAAQECALRQKYLPAHNAQGQPVRDTTARFQVRFVR